MANRLLLLPFFLLTIVTISCGQQTEMPTISPTELKAKIETNEGVVLDVRRPDEVSKGVINSSIVHFDYFSDGFNDNIAKLDKDQTYYVYCHSGGRSGKTVQKMKELGFKNVYNVDGGITKWQAEGMKLVEKEE